MVIYSLEKNKFKSCDSLNIASMDRLKKIRFSDLFLPPNLLSELRMLLVIPIIYFLSSDTEGARYISLALLVLAGITDYFDGYLARRFRQISRLGLILDPLSDKVITIALLIGLVLHREFPLWLAMAIMGRDLIILIAAALMAGKSDEIPPSDLYGKYYFASIAILLVSSILHYKFGQALFEIITIVLLPVTMTSYGFRLRALRAGGELDVHPLNKPVFHNILRVVWYGSLIPYIYFFVMDMLGLKDFL